MTIELETLADAVDWLRERLDEGVRCPCCTQFAKVYRRRIHAGMAAALLTMYRAKGREWFYLPDLTNRWQGRDEAGLRYWGLIEEAEEKRDDGGRAGWWRVTPAGERFALAVDRVPKYARIYDGRCLGFLTEEAVSIFDALGKRFDYAELMSA